MAGYYDGNGVWIETDQKPLTAGQAAAANAVTLPPTPTYKPGAYSAPKTVTSDVLYNSPFYSEDIDPLSAQEAAEVQKNLAGVDPNAGIKAPGFAQVNFPGDGTGGIQIENSAGGPQKIPKPTNPYGTSFDPSILAGFLKDQRQKDLTEGLEFGSKYFGEGNADMAEILKTRRERSMGLNPQEIQLYRDRGGAGINQQMATGLRALKGVQATSGVRGGAAGAQAIPIVSQANQARGVLERDIGIADMERRSKELGDYESSLTGERAGLLGTGFGMAGLGAADRSSALQYGLGRDFLNTYNAAADKDVDLGESEPWSMAKWKESGFDPRNTPWSSWMHENVFDPKDYGFDSSKYSPNQYLGKQLR